MLHIRASMRPMILKILSERKQFTVHRLAVVNTGKLHQLAPRSGRRATAEDPDSETVA